MENGQRKVIFTKEDKKNRTIILPSLSPGVVVHVHDVFSGFEYPLEWLKRGWYWNEDYLLRAFLMFNEQFEILLWPSFMLGKEPEAARKMPMCMKNTGGSFWMRRRMTSERTTGIE